MRPIPKDLADYIWDRDDSSCRLCGRRLNRGEGTIHHLWKRSEFIPQDIDIPKAPMNNHPLNLVLLCGRCHVELHQHPEYLREWRKEALAINRWLMKKRPPQPSRFGTGAPSEGPHVQGVKE